MAELIHAKRGLYFVNENSGVFISLTYRSLAIPAFTRRTLVPAI
jgi:hypothetical protein